MFGSLETGVGVVGVEGEGEEEGDEVGSWEGFCRVVGIFARF